MEHIKAGLILIAACLALVGCAGTSGTRAAPQYAPAPQAEEDDAVDLVPPVPTFVTIADCELAYGVGECGSGGDIYARANMPPPVEVVTWYMPYSYGIMTGVLVHRHFAPPALYLPAVQYGTFVSPVVVQKYRVINETAVLSYRRAPLSIQREVLHSGPVRFSPHRGVITARPYVGVSRPRPQQPVSAPVRPGPSPVVPAPKAISANPSPPTSSSGAQPKSTAAPYVAPTTTRPAGSGSTPRATPVQPAPAQPAPTRPKNEAPAAKAAPAPVQPKKEAPVTRAPPAQAPAQKAKQDKPCNPNQPKSPTNCA